MLTVKQIRPCQESIFEATSVSLFGGELHLVAADAPVLAQGIVYVMNEAGRTIAKYDLDRLAEEAGPKVEDEVTVELRKLRDEMDGGDPQDANRPTAETQWVDGQPRKAGWKSWTRPLNAGGKKDLPPPPPEFVG